MFAPKRPSPELIIAEGQLELLFNFQADAMDACRQKCINLDFKEGQMSTAEKSCTDRCIQKFFEANALVQKSYLMEMERNKAS